VSLVEYGHGNGPEEIKSVKNGGPGGKNNIGKRRAGGEEGEGKRTRVVQMWNQLKMGKTAMH